MLLQTNSYIVPKDKRTEHARLIVRFKQTLARLGCDHFEAYEQVGANWSPTEATGRFVQIMRFRDRKQQQQVQAAERSDPAAQALIKEFCELINFPYQQQQGLFAVGFYSSILPTPSARIPPPPQQPQPPQPAVARSENGPVPAAAPPAPPPLSGPEGSQGESESDSQLPPQPPPLPSEPQQEGQGPEEMVEGVLVPREGDSPATPSDPNGEFNIDDFIDEQSPPKEPQKDNSDRAMQYEP